MTITISDGVDSVATTNVSADNWFIIEADVRPGTWHVDSEVTAEAGSSWWGALGPVLDVDPAGEVRCAINCSQGLRHVGKVELTSPSRGEVVTEPRPTLRWVPVPGASQYGVRWFELPTDSGRMKPTERVVGTNWTFPDNLVTSRHYQWDVEAYDAAGATIARMNGTFLTPGRSLPRAKGITWLGVNPISVEGRGVVVGAVVPGSPAAIVGLRAGSVVVSFGGGLVVDADEFRKGIARTAAGTTVDLVVKDPAGVRTTLRPTIEARPER